MFREIIAIGIILVNLIKSKDVLSYKFIVKSNVVGVNVREIIGKHNKKFDKIEGNVTIKTSLLWDKKREMKPGDDLIITRSETQKLRWNFTTRVENYWAYDEKFEKVEMLPNQISQNFVVFKGFYTEGDKGYCLFGYLNRENSREKSIKFGLTKEECERTVHLKFQTFETKEIRDVFTGYMEKDEIFHLIGLNKELTLKLKFEDFKKNDPIEALVLVPEIDIYDEFENDRLILVYRKYYQDEYKNNTIYLMNVTRTGINSKKEIKIFNNNQKIKKMSCNFKIKEYADGTDFIYCFIECKEEFCKNSTKKYLFFYYDIKNNASKIYPFEAKEADHIGITKNFWITESEKENSYVFYFLNSSDLTLCTSILELDDVQLKNCKTYNISEKIDLKENELIHNFAIYFLNPRVKKNALLIKIIVRAIPSERIELEEQTERRIFLPLYENVNTPKLEKNQIFHVSLKGIFSVNFNEKGKNYLSQSIYKSYSPDLLFVPEEVKVDGYKEVFKEILGNLKMTNKKGEVEEKKFNIDFFFGENFSQKFSISSSFKKFRVEKWKKPEIFHNKPFTFQGNSLMNVSHTREDIFELSLNALKPYYSSMFIIGKEKYNQNFENELTCGNMKNYMRKEDDFDFNHEMRKKGKFRAFLNEKVGKILKYKISMKQGKIDSFVVIANKIDVMVKLDLNEEKIKYKTLVENWTYDLIKTSKDELVHISFIGGESIVSKISSEYFPREDEEFKRGYPNQDSLR